MSIEFFCSPEPLLSDPAIMAVMSDLTARGEWGVVRATPTEVGLCYSPDGPDRREEVTLYFSSKQVCVAFHVGTRSQRDMLVNRVKTIFAAQGISCDLKED